MDPMCRYIRLALSTIVELWSSDSLLTEYNESWYRTHVYGPVFDNAFTYDKDFVAKRADCISNITKEFVDIPNQRVDFILRNLNDNTDYLSVEEKSGLKGVKKDIEKGKVLQQAMLRKWIKHVSNSKATHLEAVTCQWQEVKLTIIGTRYLSQYHSVTYKKGTFIIPKVINYLASFSQTLAAVLSLKRLVYLNYKKLNIILETKKKFELELMQFQHDNDNDEFSFRSDSTEGYENNNDEPKFIDLNLDEDIIEALQNIKNDDELVTCKDWKEFIVKKTTRKRKSTVTN
ncbi:hypothetical protein G6F61_011369 [Rhizopus arrhizus]|nr:hypothetical protein G6F61_011369 [Rhizopus arrhizus]